MQIFCRKRLLAVSPQTQDMANGGRLTKNNVGVLYCTVHLHTFVIAVHYYKMKWYTFIAKFKQFTKHDDFWSMRGFDSWRAG